MHLLHSLTIFLLSIMTLSNTYKNPSLDEIFAFVDYFGNQDIYTGIGEADFDITTNSSVAQIYFNQGIALLHDFWNFEALRSFRRVILEDVNCPMGYYGFYKALQWDRGYIKGRNESLIKANSLSALASEREQLYITAENGNFQWYNETFQKIFKNYPLDLEAKVFWAWNVVDASVTIFGHPLPMREQAVELLNSLVVTYPENAAIHHYIVHAWEDTYDPENALNSSVVLETLTPSAPHANHMPGHIYFLTGNYKKAHDIFYQSYLSDQDYMDKYNIGMENNWEYIHNLAFMVANLAESGRYREAISFALTLQSLEQKHPQVQVLDFNPDTSRSAARYFFHGLCSLPFIYFRYSEWETADAVLYLIISKYSNLFNETNTYLLDYFQSLRVWSQGMNFVKNKDFNSAINSAKNLLVLITQLNNTMSEGVAYDYSVVARSYFALRVKYSELAALSQSNGNYDDVINALQIAADLESYIPYNEPTAYPRPVLTSLAETYIAYAAAFPNRTTELLNNAIDAYNDILDSPLHSKSGFALFGIANCYQLLKDTKRALDSYNTFLEAWQDADDNLPQVMVANTYVAANSKNTDQTIYFWIMIGLAVLVGLLGIVLGILIFKSLARKHTYNKLT